MQHIQIYPRDFSPYPHFFPTSTLISFSFASFMIKTNNFATRSHQGHALATFLPLYRKVTPPPLTFVSFPHVCTSPPLVCFIFLTYTYTRKLNTSRPFSMLRSSLTPQAWFKMLEKLTNRNMKLHGLMELRRRYELRVLFRWYMAFSENFLTIETYLLFQPPNIHESKSLYLLLDKSYMIYV